MPQINHWWTTRPKRKLITIVEVLRVFLTVAEGKVWYGNRPLHLEFEQALEDQGLKGVGARRDQTGGGARTYAAWLMSFGLWFADGADGRGAVHATFAGDDLLKGASPVQIFTKQILDFQYPSQFSHATFLHARFRIFPFRFVLKLLLRDEVGGYLTQNELAGCVLPFAETDADLAECARKILRYRRSGYNDAIFDTVFEQNYGKLSKLRDTANTFFNQLEFTQLIDRGDGSRISIVLARLAEVRGLVVTQPALNTRTDEHEYFLRKYGLGPNHQRDNRNFVAGAGMVAAPEAEKRSILLALWDILAREPIRAIDAALICRISNQTGVRVQTVERVITSMGVRPTLTVFEERYLTLSMSGREFATEFEKATEGVFGINGLGYETKWVGSLGNTPDVLAISVDSTDPYISILDTKAYKAYTISGDERRRMTHVYIPRYRVYSDDGSDYRLSYFSYIAGGFGNTIDRGITQIHRDTGIGGSAITAQVLLRMLNQHQAAPFTKTQLRNFFTLGRQLVPTDFES
ncbi:MAG: AlwI family type II restriction endonuclease [Acidobacteria bacterium]|nr:AlwI family type II restriction endonuclease [Acidobacteriota bacterium]